MWISIICMGRIIGFTTSRETVTVQPPPGINFDDFLQGTPQNNSGIPAPSPPPKQ